jgi:hypothetical protein
MTLFETAATTHCKAVFDTLTALETANPTVDFTAHHAALKDGMDALAQQHPGIVRPDTGTKGGQ